MSVFQASRPAPPRRLRPAALPAAAALLALAGGCDGSFSMGGPGEETESAAAPERERTRVRVAELEQREMVHAIETHTVVESERQIQLFPRIAGVVTEVLVEEGDMVSAGQVLLRMDRRELELSLEEAQVSADEARSTVDQLELAAREAESRVAALQRSFEQAERDHTRNERIAITEGDGPALISEKDLDASRLVRDTALGELEQARLALERARVEQAAARTAVARAVLVGKQAEIALSHTELVAPFDGVIAERTAELGDMASTATPAYVLSDPFRLRVRFFRPQRELDLFSRAATEEVASGAHELAIEATAEAHPGRAFRGRIQRIAPTIDTAAGAFRVTAELERSAIDDTHAVLLPGMLVRLRIVTDRHPDALVVPKRAVRREGDATLVFAVRDDVARRIEVHEGFTSDEHVEITVADDSELAPGDLIVVVGNRDLEDGVEVDIEDRRPAAAEEAPAEPAVADGDVEDAQAASGDEIAGG